MLALPKNKKRRDLVDFIRGKIWSGEWASGHLLPPRVWFEEEFGAAPITVQRGFQKLLDQRLLEADRRRGTRVCDRLPHLSRYGVVAAKGRDDVESFFLRSFQAAVTQYAAQSGRQIEFLELPGVLNGSASQPEVAAFANELNERMFAGLLFIDKAFFRLCGELPAHFHTPCFVLDDSSHESCGGILVSLEEPFLEKLMPHLPRTPHNRIAFLLAGWHDDQLHREEAYALCHQYGFECAPGHMVGLNPDYAPSFASEIVELMFAADRTAMPELLVVGNDNFLPPVVAALRRRFGNEAENRVLLWSHANFPQTQKIDFPVHLFGLDLARMLRDVICEIDRIHRGEPWTVPRLHWCAGEDFGAEKH